MLIRSDGMNFSETLVDEGGQRLLAKARHDKTIIGEVEIIHRSKYNGKEIFTRTIRQNDLLVTGSVFVSEKMNGFRSTFITTPIDVELGVHNAEQVDTSTEKVKDEVICGLMIGNGGAGDTYNTVERVRRANRMVPGPVPFRVVPLTNDLKGTERAQYILRRTRGEYAYYYGKRPDTTQTMTVAYEDGTIVPTNVGDGVDNNKFIRIYTTFRVTVGKDDVREYFKLTQGSTMRSLVNSVGLITGYPGVDDNNNAEWFNVRGLTTLNMENQELKDSESTITFIYRLFVQ